MERSAAKADPLTTWTGRLITVTTGVLLPLGIIRGHATPNLRQTHTRTHTIIRENKHTNTQTPVLRIVAYRTPCPCRPSAKMIHGALVAMSGRPRRPPWRTIVAGSRSNVTWTCTPGYGSPPSDLPSKSREVRLQYTRANTPRVTTEYSNYTHHGRSRHFGLLVVKMNSATASPTHTGRGKSTNYGKQKGAWGWRMKKEHEKVLAFT